MNTKPVSRRKLFPHTDPRRAGRLRVSSLHELYWEDAGPVNGIPVLGLHGGPGGGASAEMRRFFDPRHYRVVLFDQRGCGRSSPYSSLEDNTTWDLIEDIEKLRKELGIEKWLVFGGSWGSTLSLAYAVTHPERVSGLLLRGIFLLTQRELRWFYQEGASHIFPDAYDRYIAPIPEDERDNLLEAFYKRLMSDDKQARLEAARAWACWGGEPPAI
ncbi:MAG TPA: prolyl aminopeptidase, partial [Hyphomonadaceae bacterium]|nr:prolyl aminopeptidase [Hyphomonadaceae bacterium]